MMAQLPDLQVVTYHWYEADNSMIYSEMAKSSGLDHVAPATASISTGALNRLPLEVIHNILGCLDIATIGSFRCLSWSTRLLVDLFPQYRNLAIHASSVLRVLYSTNLASTYTVGQLYAVLTNDRCICCEAFGPYLSLVTCERCCISCIYDPKIAPITLSTAVSVFGLSKSEIEKKIFVVTTLPGIYTIGRREWKRKMKAVSVAKVLALAVKRINKTPFREEDVTKFNKKARNLTRNPIRHLNHPITFMVLTPIPHLNNRDHRTELGIWCRGCELMWYRQNWPPGDDYERALNTAYSKEEYLRHFEKCNTAKELWELYVREGKGIEHFMKWNHREWPLRVPEKKAVTLNPVWVTKKRLGYMCCIGTVLLSYYTLF